eukprot:PITA_21340
MEVGRRGQGRAIRRVSDEGLREETRNLTAHLAAMEAGRPRDLEGGDDSEEENIATTDGSDDEGPEIKLLRFVVTKLKGHAALWWDNVQAKRRRLNKRLIKKWDRMVTRMKSKFLPKDYQIALYRQVQNLRQRMTTVKEYTEEFYKVNLRSGYVEDTPEKTTRFVNGLWMEILNEISILSPKTIEEAYQSALKSEEKIARKQNARRGRGSGRGRGQTFGRGRTTNSNEEGSSLKTSGQTEREGNTRGGRSYQRGRGNGRGKGNAY